MLDAPIHEDLDERHPLAELVAFAFGSALVSIGLMLLASALAG